MQLFKYLLLVCTPALCLAQTIYELQPGTKNNLFELSIASNIGDELQSVSVFVQSSPNWISFVKNEINVGNVTKSEKQTAQFYFNVLDNAPIGEKSDVAFRITDNKGKSLTKVYSVKVVAPRVFKVQQNYPNPFNPSTTIKYSLPLDAFVSIKIFNVLGERVAELVNSDVKTGIHEVVFDATSRSSGFYFYIVEAKGIDGTKYFDSKKMILIK